MTVYRYAAKDPESLAAAKAKLSAATKRNCYPFQLDRVEILERQGYEIYRGEGYEGRSYLVFMNKPGSLSQMVMPDGSIVGPIKGGKGFSWSWRRVESLVSAPAAPGLVKARNTL